MGWPFWVLTAVHLLDIARLRSQAFKLHVLAPSDLPCSPDHVFWTAHGVELDEETRRAASAWASEAGLDVVDLLPAQMPAETALHNLGNLDPTAIQARFAAGKTAGQAMLVSRELADRARLREPRNPVEFARAARKLRRYTRRFGYAIAPGLNGIADDPRWAPARDLEVTRQWSTSINFFSLLAAVLALWGLARRSRCSLLAGLVYWSKPIAVLKGSPFRSPDLLVSSLLRPMLRIRDWLVGVLWPEEAEDVYGRHEADSQPPDPDVMFEPRRDSCPMCGGGRLAFHVRSGDLMQHKPGKFTVERCQDCGHVFQNPRLSPEGLAYYYRDYYDGFGGEEIQSVFEISDHPYELRAQALQGLTTPRAWLDVGSGYSHFAVVAREYWPETSFHALDFGAGIDEAERRGWVDKAIRGTFPETAERLASSYDVVSMSHYLEHTTDPLREIRAAYTVLRPGGLLLIEMPNGACPMSKPLGQWWFSWVQPQHLNLFNQNNLDCLLREAGFEPVKWYWPSNIVVNSNLLPGLILLLSEFAPVNDFPWRPRRNLAQRLLAAVAWPLSLPVLTAAALGDLLLQPYLAREGNTVNFGVVARRKD